MNKSDLIELLIKKRGLSKATAEDVVHRIFDSIREALKRGDRVELRGLGSFEVRHYDGYAGRNPRSGEPVKVEPKRLPFFKVGKEMKERVAARPLQAAAAERKTSAR